MNSKENVTNELLQEDNHTYNKGLIFLVSFITTILLLFSITVITLFIIRWSN